MSSNIKSIELLETLLLLVDANNKGQLLNFTVSANNICNVCTLPAKKENLCSKCPFNYSTKQLIKWIKPIINELKLEDIIDAGSEESA